MDRIIEIERQAFPDPYDRSIFSRLLNLEPGGFLVYEEDGEVLGYVTALFDDREAMIYSIAVSQERRRTGIGRALIESELDYLATKVEFVHLQVSVNNNAAISLYRELSFTEVGRMKRYYSNGDDAILMSLSLSGASIKRQ